MNVADPGRPPRDLTLLLTGFAEAAAAVLDSSSASGLALFDALDDCWRSLSTVPVHEEPYRTDPRTTLENFDRVRAGLQWALYEVAARGRTQSREAGPDDGEPASSSDVPLADPGCEAGVGGLPKVTPGPLDSVREKEQEQSPVPAPMTDPVRPTAFLGTGPGPARDEEDQQGRSFPPTFAEPTDRDDDPHHKLVQALTRLDEDLWHDHVRHLGRPPMKKRRAAAATPSAEQIGDLWRRFHMALLRLPGDARTSWRDRAVRTAADSGFPVAQRDSVNPDVVIPALPDGLCDTELVPLDLARPAEAAARVAPDILRELALSPVETGELDPEDPRLAWAARADQALRLVELDPELRVALVPDEQPGSLAGQQARGAYRAALLGHLRSAGQGLQEHGWTPDDRLGAAHKLDMVLGGLVHVRPAAPDSWWHAWRTRVSRLLVPLAKVAKYEVVVKPLDELERDTLKDCTVAETVKGVPGTGEPEVQWVVWTPLRPFGSLGDNRHRGRLVVRPVVPPSRG